MNFFNRTLLLGDINSIRCCVTKDGHIYADMIVDTERRVYDPETDETTTEIIHHRVFYYDEPRANKLITDKKKGRILVEGRFNKTWEQCVGLEYVNEIIAETVTPLNKKTA